MTTAMSSEAYYPLTRSDITTFDGQATELVLEMVDAGWVGRYTRKGHVVMLAPDGETTLAVARSSNRGSSGSNARASFRRWQRAQRQQAEKQKESDQAMADEEAVAEQEYFVCSWYGCGKDFKTARAKSIHEASHARETTRCPKCGREVKFLETHLQKSHSTDTTSLLESVVEAFAELEELRSSNADLRSQVARLEREKYQLQALVSKS